MTRHSLRITRETADGSVELRLTFTLSPGRAARLPDFRDDVGYPAEPPEVEVTAVHEERLQAGRMVWVPADPENLRWADAWADANPDALIAEATGELEAIEDAAAEARYEARRDDAAMGWL